MEIKRINFSIPLGWGRHYEMHLSYGIDWNDLWTSFKAWIKDWYKFKSDARTWSKVLLPLSVLYFFAVGLTDMYIGIFLVNDPYAFGEGWAYFMLAWYAWMLVDSSNDMRKIFDLFLVSQKASGDYIKALEEQALAQKKVIDLQEETIKKHEGVFEGANKS